MAEAIKVGISWPATTGPATYVNNATLQQDINGTIYLSFWQILPPVIVSDKPDEIKAKYEQLGPIEALPVAKLAMNLKDAQKVLELLKRTLTEEGEG